MFKIKIDLKNNIYRNGRAKIMYVLLQIDKSIVKKK